jgi:hypothetical protein
MGRILKVVFITKLVFTKTNLFFHENQKIRPKIKKIIGSDSQFILIKKTSISNFGQADFLRWHPG